MAKTFYALLVAGMLMFSSCATTSLLNVWKDPAYQETARKTVVMMVSQKAYIRNSLEDQFAAALQARSNNAVASYTIVPVDQLSDQENVISKVRSTGADTVLISRLVDKKTVETYVPGQTYVVPGYYGGWGPYYSPAETYVPQPAYVVPGYYGGWGSYYGTVLSSPGYIYESQYVYVETNLYDTKTEKLIWTAISETEMSATDQQLMKEFVSKMIDRLAADRIIK